MKAIKQHPIWFTCLLFFVMMILLSNIKGVLSNCFHAYDFGLYQQGIYNIAGGESLNPFLTVRGLKAFNDHFMPVLYLAVPLVWIFQYHPASLLVFEWLWFVLLLFLVARELSRRNVTNPLIFFSLAIIIFSKGILTGLEFPIHPGTWSIPIWFLLISKIKEGNQKQIIFYSIVLCLFRESYPFGILLLGFYYIFTRKEIRTGVILSVFSALYTYFVLVLRTKWLGPTASYGGEFLKGFIDTPIIAFSKLFSEFEFLVVIKLFLPVLLLMGFIFYLERNEKKSLTDWRIPSFLTIFPVYVIHFLTNKYNFHYGPAFIVPLLSIVFLSKSYENILIHKKASLLILIVFIATGSGRYTKFFNNLFLSKNSKCLYNEKYSNETHEIVKIVDSLPHNEKIVASGGVVQRVMRPGLKIYVPDTMGEFPSDFDYLLLLRSSAGDTYPWPQEKVEEVIKNCKSYVTNELFNSQYYYLAQGSFPSSCLRN